MPLPTDPEVLEEAPAMEETTGNFAEGVVDRPELQLHAAPELRARAVGDVRGLDGDRVSEAAALCDPNRIWRDMAMPFDAPVVEDGDIFAALAAVRKVTWGRRKLTNWPVCVHYSPVYPLLAWTSKCVEAKR